MKPPMIDLKTLSQPGYHLLDLVAIGSTVVLAGWLAFVRWHAVLMGS
jgi:hypothetical protein